MLIDKYNKREHMIELFGQEEAHRIWEECHPTRDAVFSLRGLAFILTENLKHHYATVLVYTNGVRAKLYEDCAYLEPDSNASSMIDRLIAEKSPRIFVVRDYDRHKD
jgi:hypothetical protein